MARPRAQNPPYENSKVFRSCRFCYGNHWNVSNKRDRRLEEVVLFASNKDTKQTSVHSQRVAFIVVNLTAIIEVFVPRNLVIFGVRVLI